MTEKSVKRGARTKSTVINKGGDPDGAHGKTEEVLAENIRSEADHQLESWANVARLHAEWPR